MIQMKASISAKVINTHYCGLDKYNSDKFYRNSVQVSLQNEKVHQLRGASQVLVDSGKVRQLRGASQVLVDNGFKQSNFAARGQWIQVWKSSYACL